MGASLRTRLAVGASLLGAALAFPADGRAQVDAYGVYAPRPFARLGFDVGYTFQLLDASDWSFDGEYLAASGRDLGMTTLFAHGATLNASFFPLRGAGVMVTANLSALAGGGPYASRLRAYAPSPWLTWFLGVGPTLRVRVRSFVLRADLVVGLRSTEVELRGVPPTVSSCESRGGCSASYPTSAARYLLLQPRVGAEFHLMGGAFLGLMVGVETFPSPGLFASLSLDGLV